MKKTRKKLGLVLTVVGALLMTTACSDKNNEENEGYEHGEKVSVKVDDKVKEEIINKYKDGLNIDKEFKNKIMDLKIQLSIESEEIAAQSYEMGVKAGLGYEKDVLTGLYFEMSNGATEEANFKVEMKNGEIKGIGMGQEFSTTADNEIMIEEYKKLVLNSVEELEAMEEMLIGGLKGSDVDVLKGKGNTYQVKFKTPIQANEGYLEQFEKMYPEGLTQKNEIVVDEELNLISADSVVEDKSGHKILSVKLNVDEFKKTQTE